MRGAIGWLQELTAGTKNGIVDTHANLPGEGVVEHPWDWHTQGCENSQDAAKTLGVSHQPVNNVPCDQYTQFDI